MNHSLKSCGILAIAAWIFSGCASTSVQLEQESAAANLPAPEIVLVHKFAINLDEVQAERGFMAKAIDAAEGSNTDQQTQIIAHDVADQLSNELIARINKMGLFAELGYPDTPIPPNSLFIVGQFLDVDEGNRTEQLVIGFGLGASQLDTQVQVVAPIDDENRTLLEFRTHADSGKMPGAAVTMGAGAAAQGGITAGMAVANAGIAGIKDYRSRVAYLAKSTADKAAESLSQYFAKQGWIPQSKVQKSLLP